MTIGFDLDDVLLNFNHAPSLYHNTTYGTKYERKHVTSIELSKIWNCTIEEALRRISDFYLSAEHWNATPVDGAVENIKKLKQYHNIHVTNQYHGNGLKRTKGKVCKELGIELFVDDCLENVNDVVSSGIPALLFDAPWNQGEVKPPITRVYSWDEIVDFLSK